MHQQRQSPLVEHTKPTRSSTDPPDTPKLVYKHLAIELEETNDSECSSTHTMQPILLARGCLSTSALKELDSKTSSLSQEQYLPNCLK